MKNIYVLTASVKYPSSNNFYLTSKSYVLEFGNASQLHEAIKDFRAEVEQDDFLITNMTCYSVGREQIEEAVNWQELPK